VTVRLTLVLCVLVGSQRVDAHESAARTRCSLALVHVHALAARTGFEAARAVRPGSSRSRRHRLGRRDHRDPRRGCRHARHAVAAVRAESVPALISSSAIMSAEDALVIVLADLRRRVQSITGAARQEPCAGVATDRVVAPLRREAIVLLFFFFEGQGQMSMTACLTASNARSRSRQPALPAIGTR